MESEIEVTVIDDDGDLRTVIVRYLERAGMTVSSYGDTGGVEEVLQRETPQIIILDINLPGENGFIAAARLRARSSIGIVMVTARITHEDRLLGLSMGVDHYLTKPVDLRELESVIRNLARRLHPAPGAVASHAAAAGEVPGGMTWTLDMTSWTLGAPNGATIELSSAEYQLLLPLLAKPGEAASRDVINARLGKPRLPADNRSLDVLVSRVRRKIETSTGIALPLRSARGSGYVFAGAARIEGGAIG
ncbi:MAG: response regulator transcription factor [Sphingobium sp.]